MGSPSKMFSCENEATTVIDVGSSSVKAGFSREDMPRAVFPSIVEDVSLAGEELSINRARRPEVIPIAMNVAHVHLLHTRWFTSGVSFGSCFCAPIGLACYTIAS